MLHYLTDATTRVALIINTQVFFINVKVFSAHLIHIGNIVFACLFLSMRNAAIIPLLTLPMGCQCEGTSVSCLGKDNSHIGELECTLGGTAIPI